MMVADSQLTRITDSFLPPPEGDRPPFVAVLDGINTECQQVMDMANALLAMLGGGR